MKDLGLALVIQGFKGYNKDLVEDIILSIVFKTDYPFAPLLHDFETFIKQLIRLGVFDAINMLVSTRKSYLRRVYITLPEYDTTALYFRLHGIAHRGVVVPGPIYLAFRTYIGEHKFIEDPHAAIEYVGYIVSRMVNSLSSLGFNSVLIIEPEFNSFIREYVKTGIWTMSLIQKLYNSIISRIDMELCGLYLCGKLSPMLLCSLLDTKIDYIVFDPLKYSVEELRMIIDCIRDSGRSRIGLSLIDPRTYIGLTDNLRRYRAVLKSLLTYTFMLINACETLNNVHSFHDAFKLYETGCYVKKIVLKIIGS